MTEVKDTKENMPKIDETKTEKAPVAKKTAPRGGGGLRKNPRRPRRRTRVRSELQHRVLDIRRVTRVMAGGRRFSFSVALVAGTRKGSVGVGVGKAGDTQLAIEKALRDAKKKMIYLKLTDTSSIAHDVSAKYSSARISIFPTRNSLGITAGGAVRTILEFAGVKGVSAKILSRTKNKINNARATIEALKKLPGTTSKTYVEKVQKKLDSSGKKPHSKKKDVTTKKK